VIKLGRCLRRNRLRAQEAARVRSPLSRMYPILFFSLFPTRITRMALDLP
jgi:hypothetical protein